MRQCTVNTLKTSLRVALCTEKILRATNILLTKPVFYRTVVKRIRPSILFTSIFILLAFQIHINADQKTPKVEMLLVDKPIELIEDSIKIKAGDIWFAIEKTKNGFSLKKKKIEINTECYFGILVEKSNDEECDSGAGIVAGVTGIKNSGLTYYVILLRGVASFKEGPIKTVFYNEQEDRQIYVGKKKMLDFDNCFYTIEAVGEVIDNHTNEPEIKNYSLVVQGPFGNECEYVGQQNLIIYESTTYSYLLPYLSWAGDIDNDGKLDMLFKTNPECGEDFDLYLSSFAKKDEIVGFATHAGGWCM